MGSLTLLIWVAILSQGFHCHEALAIERGLGAEHQGRPFLILFNTHREFLDSRFNIAWSPESNWSVLTFDPTCLCFGSDLYCFAQLSGGAVAAGREASGDFLWRRCYYSVYFPCYCCCYCFRVLHIIGVDCSLLTSQIFCPLIVSLNIAEQPPTSDHVISHW